jgi:hypothetical protein
MGDGVNNADDVIVLDGTRKEFGDFVAVDRTDFTIVRVSTSRCWGCRGAARRRC